MFWNAACPKRTRQRVGPRESASAPGSPSCLPVLWDLGARGISPLGKQGFSPALRAHKLQARLTPSPAGSLA